MWSHPVLRACVCARACACVRVCVRVCVYTCVHRLRQTTFPWRCGRHGVPRWALTTELPMPMSQRPTQPAGSGSQRSDAYVSYFLFKELRRTLPLMHFPVHSNGRGKLPRSAKLATLAAMPRLHQGMLGLAWDRSRATLSLPHTTQPTMIWRVQCTWGLQSTPPFETRVCASGCSVWDDCFCCR